MMRQVSFGILWFSLLTANLGIFFLTTPQAYATIPVAMSWLIRSGVEAGLVMSLVGIILSFFLRNSALSKTYAQQAKFRALLIISSLVTLAELPFLFGLPVMFTYSYSSRGTAISMVFAPLQTLSFAAIILLAVAAILVLLRPYASQ